MEARPRLRLASPVVPAAGICALALAASALDPRRADWDLVLLAGVVAAVVVAAAALVPWARLPADALVVLPAGCDLVVALMRHAQGGSTSGYAPLVVLSVVWAGLTLGRHAIAAMTLCTTLVFAVPILVVGAPLYPDTGWRAVALWAVVAAVVGDGAHRIVADHRRLIEIAAARAGRLDRLVATQNVIATSTLDVDAVMDAVVREARALTDADAAVVELPEGRELVYRAVAGTAEPYRDLRLRRDGALSGRAFATKSVLVCADSETDERVDRDACRAVGARSMVVVPLVHADRAMGVLKVYSAVPGAFTEEQVQVLSLLASMIATALVRAELVRKLSEQAATDELTGLPNRRSWHEQLAGALRRARRSGAPMTVLLLDLDGFKDVNDRHGHAAGDRLLRSLAGRWTAVLRETDVLGRLGGDEFAVLLERTGPTAAAEVVARLEEALAADVPVSASVGIATWDGTEDADALLARADAAMYGRKRKSARAAAAAAG